MNDYLLVTMPITGHVLPGLPIARALVARGHRVRWYTGKKFRTKVEATGARFVPMIHGHDFDDADLTRAFPRRVGLSGLAQLKHDLQHVFMDGAARHFEDLVAVIARSRPDVVLGDTGTMAPAMLFERTGVPFAQFGVSALTLPSKDTAPFGLGLLPGEGGFSRARNAALNWLLTRAVFRREQRHFDGIREDKRLTPLTENFFASSFSPFLYLHGSLGSFEYRRSDLPRQVHFVGPFAAEPAPDFRAPDWWSELDSKRPVIHVTQGTASTDPAELITPAIAGLAQEDALVVVCTGRPVEAGARAGLPKNVRLESFLPYSRLLPHVDVMVTNGGFGGVQAALSHGIPLVASGATEEKPEICNRIVWSGVGVSLGGRRVRAEAVRDAVREVLQQSRYREQAQRMEYEIAQGDAAQRAASLLEQLAMGQQPVNSTSELLSRRIQLDASAPLGSTG